MRIAVLIGLLCLTACQSKDSTDPLKPLFTDVANESGLEFVHFNGMSGALYFPEIMGSGVGLLDYDQDGDLDIYLVQSANLRPINGAQPLLPPKGALRDRLFRNDSDLARRSERLTFTEVTQASGLDARGYGMGVAVGDVNNDGYPDIYVTNFGPNEIWINQRDGTFQNETQAWGIGDTGWSVSASFFDFDGDGWLDLYVGNYVDFSLSKHKVCRSTTSASDYCSPKVYQPQPDRLYKNNGQSFVDITQKSGIAAVTGAALGVVVVDLNGDGRPDLYVANDGMANQLWINQGSDQFVNTAPIAGVAVNLNGAAEASMGVDAGDFDNDGDDDLFMTHLARETNTLYVNDGKGWFEDQTIAFGLADDSLVVTGFGTAWFDYDNDGLLDLYSANGAVTFIESQRQAGEIYPLKQPNQLFRNTAVGFEDASSLLGHKTEQVSRGLAVGDIDNDGDPDLLISNNAGSVELLLNTTDPQQDWIGFDIRRASSRVAVGAKVGLRLSNGNYRWSRVHRDGSYASSRDPRVLFSLNGVHQPLETAIVWPDGSSKQYTQGIEAGKYNVIRNAP